ncbi:MAG: SIMPL domain-containing protein [Gaiellales bacterium]
MTPDRSFSFPTAAIIGGVLLVAVLALGIWRTTDDASAVPAAQQRLITFSGFGTAQLAPDSASISAGVSATGSSADEAQKKTSTKMERLVKHMKGQGLTSKQLQTTDASVYEDYEHKGRFQASQSLTITLDDPSRAGELLGQATHGGADTVSGPSFGLDDRRAGYDEAMRAALADARAKADAAAAQMGAKVRDVYAIGESGASSGGPTRTFAMDMDGAAAEAKSVPVEAGTQDVTLSVEVSFTYQR